jgi:hypothetical protein
MILSRRKVNLIWLALYLATITGIVLLVLAGRKTTLREFDTPEARAQWQAWREAEPNQDTGGPVRRRPPSSVEPPALVLMRDYFAVVMSAAVLFGSLLFAALMMAARGVFSRDAPREPGG